MFKLFVRIIIANHFWIRKNIFKFFKSGIEKKYNSRYILYCYVIRIVYNVYYSRLFEILNGLHYLDSKKNHILPYASEYLTK